MSLELAQEVFIAGVKALNINLELESDPFGDPRFYDEQNKIVCPLQYQFKDDASRMLVMFHEFGHAIDYHASRAHGNSWTLQRLFIQGYEAARATTLHREWIAQFCAMRLVFSTGLGSDAMWDLHRAWLKCWELYHFESRISKPLAEMNAEAEPMWEYFLSKLPRELVAKLTPIPSNEGIYIFATIPPQTKTAFPNVGTFTERAMQDLTRKLTYGNDDKSDSAGSCPTP